MPQSGRGGEAENTCSSVTLCDFQKNGGGGGGSPSPSKGHVCLSNKSLNNFHDKV